MSDIFTILMAASAVLFFLGLGFTFVLFKTKQRIAEEHNAKLKEIEQSEKKYRDLFEHSLAGMFRFTIDTFQVYDVNGAGMEIFNSTTLEDFQRRIQTIPEETLHIIKSSLRGKGIISNVEILIKELRWVLFSAKTDGMNSAHGIIIDITKRKEYEGKIEQQAQLLNESTDAIIVIETDGRILFWNKTAERIYQWRKEEVKGKDIKKIIVPKNSENAFIVSWEECLSTGEWFGELVHHTKHGKELLVDSHWKLVEPKNYKRKEILIINTDITEKRQMEIYSLRAQKLETVALLTSSIAHDLQNILAPVSMSIGLLKDDPANPNNVQILEEVNKSTQNGLELVKNVLAMGRGMKGERIRVDVGSIVLSELEHFIITNEKSIKITHRVESGIHFVNGDEQQLKQVFHNILNNAIDAVSEGGSINVTASNPDDNIEVLQELSQFEPENFVDIIIADNGIGITEEDQKRIFDPFFTTKEDTKGTGLGLPIVQNIVRNHGGVITVESQFQKGSSFHVILPLVKEWSYNGNSKE